MKRRSISAPAGEAARRAGAFKGAGDFTGEAGACEGAGEAARRAGAFKGAGKVQGEAGSLKKTKKREKALGGAEPGKAPASQAGPLGKSRGPQEEEAQLDSLPAADYGDCDFAEAAELEALDLAASGCSELEALDLAASSCSAAPSQTAAESEQLSFTVTEPYAGLRLDLFLAASCPQYSRSQLARLAKEGLARLDGRPVKASAAVAAGQIVSLPRPPRALTELEPDPSVLIEPIFEDEHILVLQKPWGLLVHPAPGRREPTLAAGLLARNQKLAELGDSFRPGLVHRLDRDTSGILITAKTELALRRLAACFSARETEKIYLAFVKGCPAQGSGLIDQPIGRHRVQRHKMAVEQGGRPAQTYYKVIGRFPASGLSLIWLRLITGRTHQARVHLASLGTPVLADPVYSRGVAEIVRRQPSLEPWLKRQLLHARRLSLPHPLSGQRLSFYAPWPPDFLGLMRALLAVER